MILKEWQLPSQMEYDDNVNDNDTDESNDEDDVDDDNDHDNDNNDVDDNNTNNGAMTNHAIHTTQLWEQPVERRRVHCWTACVCTCVKQLLDFLCKQFTEHITYTQQNSASRQHQQTVVSIYYLPTV